MDQKQVRVGVGVMITKEGKVLLGLRQGSHGAGQWAFPGGHLEYMESFEACATRESEEEVGIKIKNIHFLFLANMTSYAPKHYVHIGLIADWDSGEPQVKEPDKCERWEWFDPKKIPSPMFHTTTMSITSMSTGQHYFPKA